MKEGVDQVREDTNKVKEGVDPPPSQDGQVVMEPALFVLRSVGPWFELRWRQNLFTGKFP